MHPCRPQTRCEQKWRRREQKSEHTARTKAATLLKTLFPQIAGKQRVLGRSFSVTRSRIARFKPVVQSAPLFILREWRTRSAFKPVVQSAFVLTAAPFCSHMCVSASILTKAPSCP